MEQCEQFKHLLAGVKKHTKDIKIVGANPNAYGTIKGYSFRLFQGMNIKNGDWKPYAVLCIDDQNAQGTKWSAFYDQIDINEWAKNH